jgi:predicted secreted protein
MSVYRNPDIPIEVILGQIFNISLKSTPSTGYIWKPEYDFAMIELIKPPQFVPLSSLIGGGGEEIFEFQTKQLGETQIKMKYQRDWEMTHREIKVFTVHTTVSTT